MYFEVIDLHEGQQFGWQEDYKSKTTPSVGILIKF